jgi:diaminohydroxyphosphoribosylaminopyrimidine deaminase/5-amino-6-(5-phosphoribosylamino)uracil reductase
LSKALAIAEPGALPPQTAARAMTLALTLAARGLGRVWPNPAVGCVILRDGHIIGRGWTQAGGRPHAETEALRRAGAAARGATAVVSFEPCSHHGETPPCADALIEAGIRQVVTATEDPDPRVHGRGIERLRAAGVAVTTGTGEEAARALNRGFILKVTQQRPMFTLKLATSLDGRIAAAGGDSRWITGPEARQVAHRLRASHDAVLVGAATALSDDPELTCRLPGMEASQPVRIVLDGRLRLPARRHPTWIVTAEDADRERVRAVRHAGAEVIVLPHQAGAGCAPAAIAKALAERGLTRVLIEGGGQVAGSFVRDGLVDDIAWFRAPTLLGGDAVAALAPLGVHAVAEAPRFARRSFTSAGGDLFEAYDTSTAPD